MSFPPNPYKYDFCGLCGDLAFLRPMQFVKSVSKNPNGSKCGVWVDEHWLCLNCRTSGEHILPGEEMWPVSEVQP